MNTRTALDADWGGVMIWNTYSITKTRDKSPADVRSALHRARGEALDHVFVQVDVDDDDRERGQGGGGHELAPEREVGDHEFGEADGERLQAVVGDEDQRVEELVPRQREAEEPGGEQA